MRDVPEKSGTSFFVSNCTLSVSFADSSPRGGAKAGCPRGRCVTHCIPQIASLPRSTPNCVTHFVGDDVEGSYESGEPIGVSTPAGLSGSHCQRRHAAPLRRLIAASSPRGGAKGAAAPVRRAEPRRRLAACLTGSHILIIISAFRRFCNRFSVLRRPGSLPQPGKNGNFGNKVAIYV